MKSSDPPESPQDSLARIFGEVEDQRRRASRSRISTAFGALWQSLVGLPNQKDRTPADLAVQPRSHARAPRYDSPRP